MARALHIGVCLKICGLHRAATSSKTIRMSGQNKFEKINAKPQRQTGSEGSAKRVLPVVIPQEPHNQLARTH